MLFYFFYTQYYLNNEKKSNRVNVRGAKDRVDSHENVVQIRCERPKEDEMGRCAFFWLSCFLKSRYCFQLLIVHKPADDRRKFAGLSTFDLAAGTFWKDFLKYMVCYRMIVIKCVCLWVFQLCCSEKLSVFFCSVCQCIYSLCCCTSDVSIQC